MDKDRYNDLEKIPFIDQNDIALTNGRCEQEFLKMDAIDNKEESRDSPRLATDSTLVNPISEISNGSLAAAPFPDTVDKVINLAKEKYGNGANGTGSNKPEESPNESLRRHSYKFSMHKAAETGKVKELEKLLQNGDPFQLDYKKRTPLHYACGFAYQKKAIRMVQLILNCRRAQNIPEDTGRKKRLLDFQDSVGETGLHIAAKTGHPEVVIQLLFSAADVNLKDKDGVEPLQLIYHKVPTAMMPVLDGAVECTIGDPNDQNLTVMFDFGAIVGYLEPDQDASTYELETKLLSYCLGQSEQKRSAILLHPVVQTFLFLKWKKVRILLWLSIFYHVIWLLLYTVFITDLYLILCPYNTSKEIAESNHTSNITTSNETTSRESYMTRCEIGHGQRSASLLVELGFLFFVSFSVALKEIFEIFSSRKTLYYFLQLENVGQWLLIGAVVLTSLPVFMKDGHGEIVLNSWQYQAAAFGIFLAWSLILSQIGKIPRFGIYIEILAKVLRSFLMFMITFASLLVAFCVSFQILMPEKVEFASPWGFVKVIMMMIGEMDYDDVFYGAETSSEIPFPTSTKLLYALFVTIVTIILFNLLIGLTVSDIQGLQSVAQLSSLSSQLEQIYLMEKFVMSKKIQNRLKRWNKNHYLRYFLVTQQTQDPETNMAVTLHISKIPRELQHPVREKARPNLVQDVDEDYDVDVSNSKPEVPTNEELKIQIKNILMEILEEMKNSQQNQTQE